MIRERKGGFALLCTPAGKIEQIIRDDKDIAQAVGLGQSIKALVDTASRSKMMTFLALIRQEKAAFNWDLNVAVADTIDTYQFAGALRDGRILIVGAPSNDETIELYEEMMRMQNEQLTQLRTAVKEQSVSAAERSDQDAFNELTRLNNELVNAQRELAKKNHELDQLNRQKNQFLGMAAHDLRNPLGVIQTYSDFLRQEAADCLSDEQIEFIETIYDSSDFMLTMVNELLDIATIEAGEVQLDEASIDLLALLKKNLTLHAPLAHKKQIALTLDAPSTVPALVADRHKVVQILNNLLSNAIKYSPPGGVVTVRLQIEENELVVSVADQGQGIPAEEQDRLFRPFSRTSVKTTGGEASTGLGLAITRCIVSAHGGDIWVESEEGRGSTFFVSLPLPDDSSSLQAEAEAETAVSPPDRPPSSAKSLSILIADDNPINRKVMEKMVTRLGHEAALAADGKEVVEMHAQHPYDVVLMDLNMPGLDGVEATRRLRQRNQPQPYIIALTASSEDEDRQKCLQAGMDAFLTKPPKADELKALLCRQENQEEKNGS